MLIETLCRDNISEYKATESREESPGRLPKASDGQTNTASSIKQRQYAFSRSNNDMFSLRRKRYTYDRAKVYWTHKLKLPYSTAIC